MTDLAGRAGYGASDEPADPSVDIERLVGQAVAKAMTAAQAQFDERAKGFQRIVAGRDLELKALRQENEELKTAGLSDDERAQFYASKYEQENAELRKQLELTRLASEFGDELPLYEQLLSAQSARDQMEILRQIRAGSQAPAQAPAAASAAPSTPAVPEVDLNNPPRVTPTDAFLLPDGTPLTEQMADQILRSVSRQSDITQA